MVRIRWAEGDINVIERLSSPEELIRGQRHAGRFITVPTVRWRLDQR